MKNIYHTDQVGSLLRPQQLLDARDAHKAGKLDDAGLEATVQESILDALKRQQAIGVEIYTDGEMRRDSWQTNVAHAIEGFDARYPIREFVDPQGKTKSIEMHTQTVKSKLRKKGRIAGQDAAYLKRHTSGPFKITMPSPNYITRGGYKPGITDKVYPTQHALQDDLVNIIREEMKEVVKDGAAYIQLDEGFIYYLTEAASNKSPAELEREILADIAAENACYDAVSEKVTLAMHICRGSRISWMHGAKGYDWLAERLFSELHVDRLLLEYDLDYDHGFEPLRFLPKGKVGVLGLISSKEPQIESVDAIGRRIDEAAKYCSLDQLALTTQCGFQAAADRDGAHINYDQQWRKIEVMMQAARKIWS